jgi:hypothetical protein
MRPGFRTLLGMMLVAPILVAGGLVERASRGDEPGRFSRLFRLGSNGPAPTPAQPAASTPVTPSLLPPPSPISTPPPPASSASPRILPQPRHSRPVTEADPLVTRAAVNRTSDGTLFCDFLMVYADGTVLDGTGVHQVGREPLKPLVEAIHSGDAFRVKGHCGGPPTDYIEQVHVVVYERNLGRLRAHSFSYSGNTDGCDNTIKHIQGALEAIQTKISGPANTAPATMGPTTMAPATTGPTIFSPGASAVPLMPSGPASTTGRVIPLTPLN